jgi:ABC-type phosphate/phosphonate transport system substrate-binding protein
LFQRDLEDHLQQPVVFDLMSPRQIRVHLGTGRAKFAMLSAADFAEIAPAGNSEILAVPTNAHGHTSRCGLIIVSSKSRAQSVKELKNRRFHFLPVGDVLNEAAMGALLESGIAKQDIDRGFLGLELDTSHINSIEVAKSVVIEDAAGIIDEADYNAWPDRGGSLVLLTPSKEQVRVIGQTVRIPEGPFVASLETPEAMREDMKHYLIEDLKNNKLVLGVLGISGFAEPLDPADYQPYFELHRKLHPSAKTTSVAAISSTQTSPTGPLSITTLSTTPLSTRTEPARTAPSLSPGVR